MNASLSLSPLVSFFSFCGHVRHVFLWLLLNLLYFPQTFSFHLFQQGNGVIFSLWSYWRCERDTPTRIFAGFSTFSFFVFVNVLHHLRQRQWETTASLDFRVCFLFCRLFLCLVVSKVMNFMINRFLADEKTFEERERRQMVKEDAVSYLVGEEQKKKKKDEHTTTAPKSKARPTKRPQDTAPPQVKARPKTPPRDTTNHAKTKGRVVPPPQKRSRVPIGLIKHMVT